MPSCSVPLALDWPSGPAPMVSDRAVPLLVLAPRSAPPDTLTLPPAFSRLPERRALPAGQAASEKIRSGSRPHRYESRDATGDGLG